MQEVLWTYYHQTHRDQNLVLEAISEVLYWELPSNSIQHLRNSFTMADEFIVRPCNPDLQPRLESIKMVFVVYIPDKRAESRLHIRCPRYFQHSDRPVTFEAHVMHVHIL